MKDPLLWTVVEETRAAEARKVSRLERFLARANPWEALAIWLGLEAGAPAPGREEIGRRLCLDVAWIDQLLAEQVDAILHHPRFQAIEASWRGLHLLTEQIGDGDNIKIRVLDVAWKDLTRDLERAIEFDQSQLFRKVYSAEFGTPGGEPFGVLLGDYYVRHRPGPGHLFDDVATLRSIGQVAAAAFAPFVTGAHPALFGLDSFADLERPIDLARIFQQAEYLKWNALRDDEDVRFVGVALPRVLLRLPYEDVPTRTDRFRYREDASHPDRSGYLWGNAVYAFGSVLIRAFAETGWLADIRGVERDVDGGGLVSGLPVDDFATDSPGLVPKGATEVMVSDVQEKEFEDLGFIALCHAHATHLAAFYGTQSIQKPKRYDQPAATVNAKLSSMLQYMLCVSRFAHYLKVIGRDKIGSFLGAADCEAYLNNWLVDYSTANEDVSSEMRAAYPLSAASVAVREVPGKPGVYNCTVHLKPHFQLDQMSSSVKLVTEIGAGFQV